MGMGDERELGTRGDRRDQMALGWMLLRCSFSQVAAAAVRTEEQMTSCTQMGRRGSAPRRGCPVDIEARRHVQRTVGGDGGHDAEGYSGANGMGGAGGGCCCLVGVDLGAGLEWVRSLWAAGQREVPTVR